MLNLRKTALTGLAVIVIGAGWLSKTIAQEKSSSLSQGKSSSPVVYFDHKKVDANFGSGVPLFSRNDFSSQWIPEPIVNTVGQDQASGPPIAEIEDGYAGSAYAIFTGVVYVLGGEATLVVGGNCGGGQNYTRAPDKFGGQSLDGGMSQHIGAGDVIIVPRGCPHWYKNAKALRYIIVHAAQRPLRPTGSVPSE